VKFEHESGEELLIVGQKEGLVGADDEDQVITFGPVVLVEAEGFAEEAFDAVAARGGADVAGNADAQAGMREIVRAGVGDERAAGGFDAIFEDGREVGAGADAVGLGE
jgi:hypothetical protein